MSILSPLGLIALISLILLILIYIIKPNFTQKFVSSTLIWKLSLKYEKRKLPVNKFRNILIFICQLLCLSILSIMIAIPVILNKNETVSEEKIYIIDCSANMLVTNTKSTRFETAVDKVKSDVRKSCSNNEYVTIILANKEAEYLVNKADPSTCDDIIDSLDSLVENGNLECYFGEGDIEGALDLAQTNVDNNPHTDIYFYTSNNYIDEGDVKVVDCKDKSEYNIAILDVQKRLEDNFYIFDISVCSYGQNIDTYIDIEINGANANTTDNISGNKYQLEKYVRLEDSVVTTISVKTNEEDSITGVYSFDYVYVNVITPDSFIYDNMFYLYGGYTDNFKICYASSKPNTFFTSVLNNLKSSFSSTYNISVDKFTIKQREDYIVDETAIKNPLAGYDFYIYEHIIPETLPTDGVVFVIDPDILPVSLDLTFAEENIDGTDHLTLTGGTPHKITDYLEPTSIELTSYKRIIQYLGYETLLFSGGDPILLLKDDKDSKTLVLSMDLNTSTLGVGVDFPLLMYNTFSYFFPSIIDNKFVYEIGEEVVVHSRGRDLIVSGPESYEFDEKDNSFMPESNAVYTISETLMNGKEISKKVYSKIPKTESNIFHSIDYLNGPTITKEINPIDKYLTLYFAMALLLLLFIEWILHLKEGL